MSQEERQRALIVVVGGEKGGTAKTTTAINLAALRTARDRDTLIVDTDPQASASLWGVTRDNEQPTRRRVAVIQKTGLGVSREILDLSRRYDDVIVDAGGRDSAELRGSMLVADVFIAPFQASSFDLWTLKKLFELYEQCSAVRNPEAAPLKVIVVITRGSTHSTAGAADYDAASDLLQDYPQFLLAKSPIRERTSFRRSAGAGLGIFEYEPRDEKAEFEMNSLYKEIYGDD